MKFYRGYIWKDVGVSHKTHVPIHWESEFKLIVKLDASVMAGVINKVLASCFPEMTYQLIFSGTAGSNNGYLKAVVLKATACFPEFSGMNR